MMVTNLQAFYTTELIIAVINCPFTNFHSIDYGCKKFYTTIVDTSLGVNFECGQVMRYSLAVLRQIFGISTNLKFETVDREILSKNLT